MPAGAGRPLLTYRPMLPASARVRLWGRQLLALLVVFALVALHDLRREAPQAAPLGAGAVPSAWQGSGGLEGAGIRPGCVAHDLCAAVLSEMAAASDSTDSSVVGSALAELEKAHRIRTEEGRSAWYQQPGAVREYRPYPTGPPMG